jgi:hypothetical protein
VMMMMMMMIGPVDKVGGGGMEFWKMKNDL